MYVVMSKENLIQFLKGYEGMDRYTSFNGFLKQENGFLRQEDEFCVYAVLPDKSFLPLGGFDSEANAHGFIHYLNGGE